MHKKLWVLNWGELAVTRERELQHSSTPILAWPVSHCQSLSFTGGKRIEIINNTRAGIEGETWERINGANLQPTVQKNVLREKTI